MRVLFEAHWWTSGPPSLRRVLRDSVSTWRKQYPDDELAILVPFHDAASVRADLPGVRVFLTRLRPQALSASIGSIFAARKFNADAVITHNFTSFSRRSRRVVLIHDFLFLDHPEWFTFAERLYFRAMPMMARRATVVLATSESEADRIRRYLPDREIRAIGLGLSEELRGVPQRKVSGLDRGSFLLCVGRLNSRKNLLRTIRGCLAAGVLSAGMPLVVVGAPDGRQDVLPMDVMNAISERIVVYTGYTSDAELAWLYGSCKLFIFLSLGEGYGLPPIEALYFGARVLVSDLPVFRETLGDAATYCDPLDSDQIALAITTAVHERVEPKHVSNDIGLGWEAVVREMRSASLG